jgi:hypothetical protein
MQHFARFKQEGRQADIFRALRRSGLSAGQTWEILREEEPLKPIELILMREQHWSLHQVRQVIHDAIHLGLIAAPTDYRAKLNAYLEQQGTFTEDDAENTRATSREPAIRTGAKRKS